MKDFKHYFELAELDEIDEVTTVEKDFNHYFELVEIDEITLEQQHQEFCKYIKMELDGVINESIIPSWIKDKLNIIKAWASQIKVNFAKLLRVFFNKKVFEFFTVTKWNLKNIQEMFIRGYKAFKEFEHSITKYIAESKIVTNIDKYILKNIDDFLEKHPNLKRIGGVLLGAMLAYIWFNSTFTGNFREDFDVSLIVAALKGAYSLSEFFGSPSGMKMLILFATGVLTGGASWFGDAGNILVAVLKALVENLNLPNPFSGAEEESADENPQANPTPA